MILTFTRSLRCTALVLSVASGAWAQEDAGTETVDAGATAADAGSAPWETFVVGSREIDPRRVAGSAQVVTAKQLERRESNDINRVLEEVPGVYVREEDGFGLRPNIGLRGAQSDRSSKVALMEDDILFGPSPYSAPAAYYFPMVTRMTAVEVWKGPAAIRFGPQTVGGAINMRTRDIPEGFAADLDLSLGSYSTFKVATWAGYGNDRWGVLGEVVHLQSAGFKHLDGGGETGFDKTELMTKAYLRLGPGRFNFKFGYSHELSHETYLGISDADFKADPYRRYFASAGDNFKSDRFGTSLNYDAKLGDHVRWVTTLYRNDLERLWHRMNGFRGRNDLSQVLAGTAPGNVGGYIDVLEGTRDSLNADEDVQTVDNHRVFVSEGAQSVVTATFMSGPLSHELEGGVRIHHDQIHRVHTADYWASVNKVLVHTGEAPITLTAALDQTNALSAWVSDSIQWGRVLLAPGFRVEKVWTHSKNNQTQQTALGEQLALLPGLGAVVSLPEDFDVLAGVHRGYSPVAPGNTGTVNPEFAWNVEAGARLTKRRLKLEVVGFYSDYSNLLSTCSLAAGCTTDEGSLQFNGGRVQVYGVEAVAKTFVRLPEGLSLHFGINYTFSDSRFTSAFVSQDPSWGVVQVGYKLPLIPAHRGQGTISLEHAKFEVGVGLAVQSDMWQVASSTAPLPSQVIPGRALLDAFVNWHANDFITLYATGTNLTNNPALAGRAPFGARAIAPIQVTAGLKLMMR